MFGRRSDATQVRNLSATRRFMPFISPRRNESLVYYTTEIEVGAALEFLDKENRTRPPDRRITLFHIYLRALAIAFHTRPGVNRFVTGGRLWQRDGVWITYSAKQELLDGSPVLTVKRRFPADEPLPAMVDAFHEELLARRRGRQSQADKEVKLALRLPVFVVSATLRLLGWANHFGLMPKSMIDDDPMYASAFVANLGSVGLEAGYHHLWEYGTCSVFAVVGRVHTRHDGKQVMEVRYSYDERVEDGMYAAITMNGIRDCFEHPETLL